MVLVIHNIYIHMKLENLIFLKENSDGSCASDVGTFASLDF